MTDTAVQLLGEAFKRFNSLRSIHLEFKPQDYMGLKLITQFNNKFLNFLKAANHSLIQDSDY